MKMWRVRVNGDRWDYADCFFEVFADTYREAWKKAIEVEDRKIEAVYCVKTMPNHPASKNKESK